MNTPADNRTLIRGASYRKAGKKLVKLEYAYLAAPATIFDEQLIEWANRREAELKAKRAHG
jgi:hypothetical protein